MYDPKTARHAVVAGVTGMLVAVLATWFQPEIVHHGWIVLAIVAGFVVGVPLSLVPLTAVPQRTALSHAFGGLAAGLVGTAEYFLGLTEHPAQLTAFRTSAIVAEVILGFLTFTGSLMAAGALDGSSGLILSIIMCRAMNRSFTNVLFGAFGTVQKTVAVGEQKAWKQETVEGAAQLLEQASLVVIIPGYGMAVAQAQHKVRELYDQLTKRGVTVKFAIHPVAGRMPGHMNVLLAEANIPYTALVEMDEINSDMPQCDVALVIGANDVVNPAARYVKDSPIYGMPIVALSTCTPSDSGRVAAPRIAAAHEGDFTGAPDLIVDGKALEGSWVVYDQILKEGTCTLQEGGVLDPTVSHRVVRFTVNTPN